MGMQIVFSTPEFIKKYTYDFVDDLISLSQFHIFIFSMRYPNT